MNSTHHVVQHGNTPCHPTYVCMYDTMTILGVIKMASLFLGSGRIPRLGFRVIGEMIPRSEICPIPVLHVLLEVVGEHCRDAYVEASGEVRKGGGGVHSCIVHYHR